MKLDTRYTTRNPQKYYAAVTKFVGDISSIDNGKIHGVVLFGSVGRGDHTPGRSDIDMLMSLDYDVVIDPSYLLQIGHVLARTVEAMSVPIELGLYDLVTLRDGRFSSIPEGFLDHMRMSGRVIYKDDPTAEIKPLNWKHGVENHVAFNLRGMRKGLVESPYYISHNPVLFVNGVLKAAERTVHFPRHYSDYSENNRKSDVSTELARIIGLNASDVEFFEELNDILHNRWEMFSASSDNALKFQMRCVEFYQNMVKKLMTLPRPSFS